MLACQSYDPQTTRHGSFAGSQNGSPQQYLSMPPHTVGKQGREGTPERNKQRRQREQAGPLPGSSLHYCSFMKWPKSSLRTTSKIEKINIAPFRATASGIQDHAPSPRLVAI